MQENRPPQIIIAGPPGAELAQLAYPVLRRYNLPVRMVVTDPTALRLLTAGERGDWLLLLPDLFESVQAAGDFLAGLPETMPVDLALPRAWLSNAGAVRSHPRVRLVFQQPCNYAEVAAAIHERYRSHAAGLEAGQPAPAQLGRAGRDEPGPASGRSVNGKSEIAGQQTASAARSVPRPPSGAAALTEPGAAGPRLREMSPAPAAGDGRPDPAAPLANVLAIWSGYAGGTGKSTIAAELARCLAAAGVSVVLLAFGGSARHLRLLGEGAGAFGAQPDEQGLRQSVQLRAGLPVIPPPGDVLTLARMETRELETAGSVGHLIRLAATRYHLVIVDCPPGTGEWALQPLCLAGQIWLVSRPSVADQGEMARALQLLAQIRRPGSGAVLRPPELILNDALPEDPDTASYQQGLATLLAGQPPAVRLRLPHHPRVRLAQNEGLPLSAADGLDELVAGIHSLAQPWLPAPAPVDGRPAQRPFDLLGVIKLRLAD